MHHFTSLSALTHEVITPHDNSEIIACPTICCESNELRILYMQAEILTRRKSYKFLN